jgi:CRISPR-associated protein Csx10
MTFLLSETFRIRLIMESDWHVGSGFGRPGSVDRLIARDANDLPFVPAKTLHGIWRDACERLCYGLDDGQVGGWSQLVDHLFGSQPALALGKEDPTGRHCDPTKIPIESSVKIRPAHIPSPMRELLSGRKNRMLRQSLTFVKPGVKIDRRSGTAQTDMLRFEEVARQGMILEAECHLPIDGVELEVASALLQASAKLVERLGGKRRRGAGRCRLEIIGGNVAESIEWLKQNQTAPPWQSTGRENDCSDQGVWTNSNLNSKESWISVPLVLKLRGPLAVSYRTTGNVVETLDFLPGSYLLPHITRCFPDFRKAVIGGDMLVLPAYPEIDGQRGQPVPIAWFSPKQLEKPLKPENRSRLINRLLQEGAANDAQLKQIRAGYISENPTKVYTTPMMVQTHNTVQDRKQRPTSDVGGVYTYEAIAPVDDDKPVVLRSELRIRKSLVESLKAEWWKKLSSPVALGRSKKDDYGSVQLTAEPPSEPHETIIGGAKAEDGKETLVVWLVSDMLLRNQSLKADPTAQCLGQELSKLLDIELKPRTSDGQLGLLDEVVRVRRLDTWHVGWGLPRPSLVALQAGSCILFESTDEVDVKRLRELEFSGIGERTAEGYGQIRFNHPLVGQPPKSWKTQTQTNSTIVGDLPANATLEPEDNMLAFAQQVVMACWIQEIRRKCLELAASPQKREELLGWIIQGQQGKPPMSQLGGLRGQLAMLRSAEDRQQVIDWLDHLDGNSRRKDSWPSIQKVKAFLTEEEKIWEAIPTKDWPTLIPNAEEDLKKKLWPLAVRTFFDASIRAHKRKLESGKNQKEASSGT